jgi:hypothetical protein
LPPLQRLCEVLTRRFEEFEQERIQRRCHVKSSFESAVALVRAVAPARGGRSG